MIDFLRGRVIGMRAYPSGSIQGTWNRPECHTPGFGNDSKMMPAFSPDLNPVEHVWDMLGRPVAAHQPPPTCLLELLRSLLDEWSNIPQDQIDNLILSMARRCTDFIALSG
ncbi:transposable element Tcb1 transposase [Trichonephila clavipes]|nr:transposable element Tcb1 transposase [Trichonephila clavipes]